MRLKELDDALANGEMGRVQKIFLQLSEPERKELKTELGADAYESVRRSLLNASRGRKRGKVILLHGIMGSELEVDKNGDKDLVWIHLWRLFRGRLDDLELDVNANPTNPKVKVLPIRHHKKSYFPALCELGRHWDVIPFSYDWRHDIRKSADALAACVRKFGAGQPVHLVAHSMGGLVCRSFIQRHSDLWNQCASDDLKAGGRLIMLGTPNLGSYVIPRALTGHEKQVRRLAKLDFEHNLPSVLKITNSFLGSYQMMPAHWLSQTPSQLYNSRSWGKHPVWAPHLKDAKKFQDEIRHVVDSKRFVYVAGFDQETPCFAKKHPKDVWTYQWTRYGDGRVPHDLGILPGVPTFYVDEAHGNLARNKYVLRSLNELVEEGTTSRLPQSPPFKRGSEERSDEFETRIEEPPQDMVDLVSKAGPARRGNQRAQESALTANESSRLESYLRGEDPAMDDGLGHMGIDGFSGPLAETAQVDIDVVWGDITEIDEEVCCVGYYEGDVPQNALRAIDNSISGGDAGPRGYLARQIRKGFLKGHLGNITQYQWGESQLVIAGMGRPGSFGMGSLRLLIKNLAWTVTEMPQNDSVACVLIGSGHGTLSVTSAVEGMIHGIIDHLRQDLPNKKIKRIQIVELYRHRAIKIHEALKKQKVIVESDLEITMNSDILIGPNGKITKEDLFDSILEHASGDRGKLTGPLAKQVRALVKSLQSKESWCSQALEESLESAVWSVAQKKLKDEAGGETGGAGDNRNAPLRLTYATTPQGIKAAALTSQAAIPERLLEFDQRILQDIIGAILHEIDSGGSLLGINRNCALLSGLMIPPDFREYVQSAASQPIVIEMDRELTSVHFEMLRLGGGDSDPGFLALRAPFARQIRTSYSEKPESAPPKVGKYSALIIGDPGDPDAGNSLPGAREEAIRVAKYLHSRGVLVTVMIGSSNYPEDPILVDGGEIPVPPADPVAVLSELYGNSYDILHFAGHGCFEDDDPSKKAGWLFGEDRLITSSELKTMKGIPPLVVANACVSAITSQTSAVHDSTVSQWEAGLLPSLADEFFKQGVRHYIGTAWEVFDEGALLFAEAFYGELLSGQTEAPMEGEGRPEGLPDPAAGIQPPPQALGVSVGAAMMKGRNALYDKNYLFGHLWAAYQHYGNPNLGIRD